MHISFLRNVGTNFIVLFSFTNISSPGDEHYNPYLNDIARRGGFDYFNVIVTLDFTPGYKILALQAIAQFYPASTIMRTYIGLFPCFSETDFSLNLSRPPYI